MTKRKTTALGGDIPTSGGNEIIETNEPYRIEVEIEGVAPLLLHRWNPESVDAKAAAAKGSRAKKTDDVESYVYRNGDGDICLPGEYLRQAAINAAKSIQDPRSPRKSAMDLFRAGLVCLTPLASLGTKVWEYEDVRRAVVQRNGVNRTRPAFNAGWKAKFHFAVVLPQYITQPIILRALSAAGQFIGVGDHRPSYGRFEVTSFVVLS